MGTFTIQIPPLKHGTGNCYVLATLTTASVTGFEYQKLKSALKTTSKKYCLANNQTGGNRSSLKHLTQRSQTDVGHAQTHQQWSGGMNLLQKGLTWLSLTIWSHLPLLPRGEARLEFIAQSSFRVKKKGRGSSGRSTFPRHHLQGSSEALDKHLASNWRQSPEVRGARVS